MPGVLKSRIGHQNGKEIVEVAYDPERATLQQLVSALKQESSFDSLVAGDKDSYAEVSRLLHPSQVRLDTNRPEFIESKHTLRTLHPDLYYLDLTEQQAIILNSWSYFGGRMPDVLSSEQKRLRKILKRKIRASGAPPLRPVREKEGRSAYREKLEHWLGGGKP